MRRADMGMAAVAGMAMLASSAFAQFNPVQGDWGKDEPTDIRVMTWNLLDALRSDVAKIDGNNQWGGLVRTIAAMKPDVLIMQECGDGDAVSTLQTVCSLMMYGGPDPFLGGTVTHFVQAFDPAFDLPYVYVSSESDGFNRNVMMSRYPFADLNGDGKATYADIAFVTSTGTYASGGDGGIRGFSFVEIDLPDETYPGNFVQGNAHLKAGSTQDDKDQRLNASKNVAYYIDYFYNGGGSGIVDPFNKISDFPVATSVLDANTPVVIGGDWNEDEDTNGRKGPAEWLSESEFAGSTDGLDFDRTDSTYDSAVDALDGSDHSFSSGSKIDYIAWQDSKATARHQFIFDSTALNFASRPPEYTGIARYQDLVGNTSDHLPVLVDLILPLGPACTPCANVAAGGAPGDVDLTDLNVVLFNFGASVSPGTSGDTNCDGLVDLTDLNAVLFDFGTNVGCGA